MRTADSRSSCSRCVCTRGVRGFVVNQVSFYARRLVVVVDSCSVRSRSDNGDDDDDDDNSNSSSGDGDDNDDKDEDNGVSAGAT